MTSPEEAAARIAALEAEVDALRETKGALVQRVERSLDEVGSSFHLFETNILLQRRVDERTAALRAANEELRKEIEERKRVEEQLLRAKEAAETASRAKSEFLAHMSHELRTPLNGILGMASVLVQMQLGHEELECAQTIQQSAETLLRSINDILDLAKAEAGKMDVDNAPFDLHDLLQSCLHAVAWPARRRGLEVRAEIHPDTPRQAFGDETRLRQVLLNLLSNACKFTERGHVVLRAGPSAEAADVVRFEVEDTGIGISPDKLGAIFEPFTQADASTTRRYGGTGLGLSICQRLVELMGGYLSVSSRPDEGSSFAFGIPLTEAPPLGRALKVLVVDDNAVNLRVAERLLERLGCQAHTETDPRRVEGRMSAHAYDLLLLDCHMPWIDGATVTRQVRGHASAPDLRILGVTADSSVDNRLHCIEAGMDDVLVKPLRPALLLRTLSRWWPPESFTADL